MSHPKEGELQLRDIGRFLYRNSWLLLIGLLSGAYLGYLTHLKTDRIEYYSEAFIATNRSDPKYLGVNGDIAELLRIPGGGDVIADKYIAALDAARKSEDDARRKLGEACFPVLEKALKVSGKEQLTKAFHHYLVNNHHSVLLRTALLPRSGFIFHGSLSNDRDFYEFKIRLPVPGCGAFFIATFLPIFDEALLLRNKELAGRRIDTLIVDTFDANYRGQVKILFDLYSIESEFTPDEKSHTSYVLKEIPERTTPEGPRELFFYVVLNEVNRIIKKAANYHKNGKLETARFEQLIDRLAKIRSQSFINAAEREEIDGMLRSTLQRNRTDPARLIPPFLYEPEVGLKMREEDQIKGVINPMLFISLGAFFGLIAGLTLGVLIKLFRRRVL